MFSFRKTNLLMLLLTTSLSSTLIIQNLSAAKVSQKQQYDEKPKKNQKQKAKKLTITGMSVDTLRKTATFMNQQEIINLAISSKELNDVIGKGKFDNYINHFFRHFKIESKTGEYKNLQQWDMLSRRDLRSTGDVSRDSILKKENYLMSFFFKENGICRMPKLETIHLKVSDIPVFFLVKDNVEESIGSWIVMQRFFDNAGGLHLDESEEASYYRLLFALRYVVHQLISKCEKLKFLTMELEFFTPMHNMMMMVDNKEKEIKKNHFHAFKFIIKMGISKQKIKSVEFSDRYKFIFSPYGNGLSYKPFSSLPKQGKSMVCSFERGADFDPFDEDFGKPHCFKQGRCERENPYLEDIIRTLLLKPTKCYRFPVDGLEPLPYVLKPNFISQGNGRFPISILSLRKDICDEMQKSKKKQEEELLQKEFKKLSLEDNSDMELADCDDE